MNKEEKEAYKYLEQAMFEEETTEKYVNILLNYIDKLQKKNEQSQEILSSIKIAYMVHTKDCELLLKDIKKWEKLLDK